MSNPPEVSDERGWSRRRAQEWATMLRETTFEYGAVERMPWRMGPVIAMAADGPNCPAHPSEPVYECFPCSEMGD